MKTFLTAWIIGTVSLLVIGFCLTLVIGVIAMTAEWGSFTVGLGPIEIMEHTAEGSSYSTRSGWAFFPVALLGGILNGLGAVYLRRRD